MKFLITIAFFLMGYCCIGQNPVKWSFSAKKLSDKTYEVTFLANVDGPWHIYSQLSPDGGPLATKFSFSKNPLVELNGKPSESGRTITKYEDVFGIDVIYFDGNASFTQVVKLKSNAKTLLSGKIQFMACNDHQCLPPTDIPFMVSL